MLSSAGQAWTTKRGARRLVDRGLAIFESEKSIRMIEADYRYASQSPAAAGPRFNVVEFQPRKSHVLIPLGYLKYPDGGKQSIKASIERMRKRRAA